MEQKTSSSIKTSLLIGKKAKVCLLSLLILLNLALRIPSIPHEKGYDSFFIHSLANSISIFGDAQWWINWLSVFGFYAYSYASAVPFVLSGMHQLLSIEMEVIILIYCVVTGVFSIFTAYVLAGRFSSKFTFKYLAALFFSTSPGVMLFSTWEVSTRGLFIVLLPLFIYLLISEIHLFKKIILLFLLLVFQFSIHHLAFIIIPIMVVYTCLLLLRRTKYFDTIQLNLYLIILPIIVISIILPFINRSLVESGSRYSWLITSLISLVRQSGPLFVLSIGGFIYGLFKKDKSINELLLLILFTLFIPAIYLHAYGAYLLLLLIVLFISISFFNVTEISINKRFSSVIFIMMILLSVTFTGFYNHNRTGESDAYWYMTQDTYVTGIWGKSYIPDNSYGLDTAFETGRLFAVSEGHPITPTISAGNLAYGFIKEDEIEYVQNSFLQKDFYFEGPYVVKGGTTVSGRMEWLRQAATNMEQLSEYKYFVQDKYYIKPVTKVVEQNYGKVYDSSRMAIWYFDHDK
ncbi:hypothetical protein RE476_05285 [Methanolobus mangrovi]|uniref:Uncharacterized protein n=1 Tax=Methanolobus mangrovi TaxID=3072977 RepID=A0AA51UI10_9EURY|nr:hypothetical protein [Methanolobus mangrovi]WMW23244.1 hypothetical protein RE476_05285 [Methanolobus mangrovi]